MASGVNPADLGVTVGQIFLGKYRVDAILGQGGMGIVAECTHLALNERVAIKMLRQDVLLDQDAVQRFVREAQAAVKLKSEYVARVSDVGTFETGVPYMVMEFLEGSDLGVLLKERGVLPIQWAIELMLQTAEALAEAHSLGIVHRDVKPTNLFVTWRPDGTSLIKVLDFGISKSPLGTDMQLTQTQSLLGTPAYMSPEQMRSARLVDSRTDIWSLGTVMYEILEGRRPFEAESFSEMCVKVAIDSPAPMMNTPPELQQVILRCLAKTSEQRYSNMAELARDLVPFAQDQYHAAMLVERMVRMLRRSQVDWDGGSVVDGRRVPREVRDFGSGPVRGMTQPPPQWSAGSDPVGAPWDGKSQPSGQAWESRTPTPKPWDSPSQPFARPWPKAPNEGSQPFARPLGDDVAGAANTVMEPRRRWPVVVVLLAVLLGAGMAIAIVQPWATDEAERGPTVRAPMAAVPAGPSRIAAATATCLGEIYDPCTTASQCISGSCKAFGASDIQVCTTTCTAGDNTTCPTQNGQPATCNKVGMCKPVATNRCTPKVVGSESVGAATNSEIVIDPPVDLTKPSEPTKHPGTGAIHRPSVAPKTTVKPPKAIPTGSEIKPRTVPLDDAKPPCDPFKSSHGCEQK